MDTGTLFVADALAHYESPLLRYAARLIGDLETARDVVQDTFFRLCRQSPGKRAELAGPPPRVGPWLFTVCRNRAYDLHRKHSHTQSLTPEMSFLDPPDPQPGPDVTAQTRDDTRHMLSLVDQLPDSQRDAICLRFQAGHSYRQIAEITGHSVGHVGYLLHHALKTLRTQMTQPTDSQPEPFRAQPQETQS